MDNEFVTCKICFVIKKDLRNHLRIHNITTEEYKNIYPNASISSQKTKETMRNGLIRGAKNKPPVSEETKAKLKKIMELRNKKEKEENFELYMNKQRKAAEVARKAKGDNFTHSEKSKQQMSGPRLTCRGRHLSEEHKNKLSKWRKGKKFKSHSEETINKMKETWRIRKLDVVGHAQYCAEISKRMSTPKAKREASERSIKNIKERTHNGKSSDTTLERKFMKYAKTKFLVIEDQFILKTRKGSFIFDFYIPEINLLVETDGKYWHRKNKEQINRDKLKEKLAKEMKYRFVRISDNNWQPEIVLENDEVITEHNHKIIEERSQIFR